MRQIVRRLVSRSTPTLVEDASKGHFRVASRLMRVCAFLLAAAFLVMNFEWLLPRALWTILQLPVPPASAWYMLEVRNASDYDLLVCAQLVNDRNFATYGPVEHFGRRMLRENGTRSAIVGAGESRLFDIPSEKDPRIGLYLVSAITAVQDSGRHTVQQRIALRLGTWQEARDPPGSNTIPVVIRNEDLVLLTVDGVKNCTPIVSVG